MEGRKMAIVPYKQWEEMNRWKQEQRPRLPPDPNVVHTVSLQKDLSSVLADDDISEAEKSQKYGETLHKFKLAHKKALQKIQSAPTVLPAAKGKKYTRQDFRKRTSFLPTKGRAVTVVAREKF